MNELMNIVHDIIKFMTEALVNTQLLFLASFFNV